MLVASDVNLVKSLLSIHLFTDIVQYLKSIIVVVISCRNVVPVKSADDVDAGSPRAEISEESTEWRSRNIPAQDPNVQSRSFKMLQQQLAAE